MTTDRSIETIGRLRRVEPLTERLACRAIAETRDDDDDDDDDDDATTTTTTNRVPPSTPTDQGTNDDDDDASSHTLTPIDPSIHRSFSRWFRKSVLGGTVGDSWSS